MFFRSRYNETFFRTSQFLLSPNLSAFLTSVFRSFTLLSMLSSIIKVFFQLSKNVQHRSIILVKENTRRTVQTGPKLGQFKWKERNTCEEISERPVIWHKTYFPVMCKQSNMSKGFLICSCPSDRDFTDLMNRVLFDSYRIMSWNLLAFYFFPNFPFSRNKWI